MRRYLFPFHRPTAPRCRASADIRLALQRAAAMRPRAIPMPTGSPGSILSTVGLVRGLVNDNVNRTRGIGADIIVRGPGSGYLTSFGSAALPESLGPKLAQQPHVVAAAPVLVIAKSGITMVNGIDDTFRKVSGGFRSEERRVGKEGRSRW